ncbi:hypothetical protein EBT16_05965 [bacterium]|nr:hypothetical protein [bacterium]
MENDKFKMEKVVVNGKEEIRLQGVIDEDTDFASLEKTQGPLYLNLSGITGINSLGIRGWVNFWKSHSDRPVFYVECPPVIVRQMSMIPSFCGHASVVSVYAPYICNHCEAEQLVLVESEQLSATPPNISESFACPKCQAGEMELDGSPRQYFAFKK